MASIPQRHYPIAYQCPLCQQPLISEGQRLVCSNRHSFDISKEGYVHLLPVNQKHSRNPGDEKAMVQARRRFFDQDHYAILKQYLKQELSGLHAQQVLDIGSGEGYFTEGVANALPDADIYGLDISKEAVRLAAKRYKNIAFCIASIKHLPFAPNSMDLVTRIYAPSEDTELKRVIRPGGRLIIVAPGADHLLSLRKRIYEEIRPHEERLPTPEGFSYLQSKQIKDMLTLKGEDLLALLEMTPFGWHASEQLKHELGQQTQQKCELDFIVHSYIRQEV